MVNWMYGWTVGGFNGCMIGQMVARIVGGFFRRLDDCMAGWLKGWMGRKDGTIVGWLEA